MKNYFKKPEYPARYRAASVPLTLGVMIQLEEILGEKTLALILEQKQAQTTMRQKRQLLVAVFGYSAEAADALQPEEFEAELAIFFSRWLKASLRGQLRFALRPLSNSKLPNQLRDSITKSQTSSN